MRHKQEADLRVRRTRTAIRSTFRQMLLDMDYEQITIQELTDRAGINRRTFYLHYSALDGLLDEVIEEIAQSYIIETQQMNTLSDVPDIIRSFLLFISKQDTIHEKIMCNRNFHYISDRVTQKINKTNVGGLSGSMEHYTRNLLITYLNTSILEMYRQWILDEKPIPLETLIRLTIQLICPGVQGLPEYLESCPILPV